MCHLRNHLAPSSTDSSDRSKTIGAMNILIDSNRYVPKVVASHQQSGTATIVSMIAITDGTSLSILSRVDQNTSFGDSMPLEKGTEDIS
jgi:hypothetical protein